MTSSTFGDARRVADETRIALRMDHADRTSIARLAKLHDRTLSSEIRRAIRFYLSHFELADRVLRDQAEAQTSDVGKQWS